MAKPKNLTPLRSVERFYPVMPSILEGYDHRIAELEQREFEAHIRVRREWVKEIEDGAFQRMMDVIMHNAMEKADLKAAQYIIDAVRDDMRYAQENRQTFIRATYLTCLKSIDDVKEAFERTLSALGNGEITLEESKTILASLNSYKTMLEGLELKRMNDEVQEIKRLLDFKQREEGLV